MGSCGSSHRKASEMKVNISFGSNRKSNNQVVIPPSPVKEKLPIIYGNVAVKPQCPPLHSTANSRDFGSKEETFFDSQAWLDSDCESDFMSVNGEFTPSRGSTPVHHKCGAPDDHSPIKKKKRLSELFSESIRENIICDEENAEPANENKVVGSGEVEVIRGGGLKLKRERWVEIVEAHGCLPRVLSSCRPATSHQTGVRRK